MKKKFNEDIKVYCEEHFDQLPKLPFLEYPYDRELLNLIKENNLFKQEYYYIQKGDSYAFFVVYHNRMDIFTFGKRALYYPVKVIGFPCSLSYPGYVTNDEKFMLDYIKTIKGAKLVLNVSNPIAHGSYVIGETLPTCMVDLTRGNHGKSYESTEAYFKCFRSSYRRRIRLAIKACDDLEMKLNPKDGRVYDLYRNTYEKSGYKLERLEPGFFEQAEANQLVFYRDNKPVGFVMLKGVGDKLIFMFCGMDYASETTDLYYFMIYNIIKYAIENKFKYIDLGQTSEETKMKFGAVLEKKYFYANHTNVLLNTAIKLGKGLLEYHYSFPDYKVFKKESEKHESTIF